jgi:hypothetical protein
MNGRVTSVRDADRTVYQGTINEGLEYCNLICSSSEVTCASHAPSESGEDSRKETFWRIFTSLGNRAMSKHKYSGVSDWNHGICRSAQHFIYLARAGVRISNKHIDGIIKGRIATWPLCSVSGPLCLVRLLRWFPPTARFLASCIREDRWLVIMNY